MNSAWAVSKGICLYKRVKLSRNLEAHVFTAGLTTDQSQQVKEIISGHMPYLEALKPYSLSEVSLENRAVHNQLMAEGLLLTDPIKSNLATGLFLSKSGQFAISINDLDHLRLTLTSYEESFDELWQGLDLIDDSFSQVMDFAYLEPFGYLTSRVEQLGTAWQGEALLHLPALKRTGFIQALSESLGAIGITIKPWKSDFYTVFNTVTLGRSEVELALLLDQVVDKLAERERAGRETLWASEGLKLKDGIGRAYGNCQYAATAEHEEALQWLSELMLGETYGLLLQPTAGVNKALNWQTLIRDTSAHALEVKANRALNYREKVGLRSDLLHKIHLHWQWRG